MATMYSDVLAGCKIIKGATRLMTKMFILNLHFYRILNFPVIVIYRKVGPFFSYLGDTSVGRIQISCSPSKPKATLRQSCFLKY